MVGSGPAGRNLRTFGRADHDRGFGVIAEKIRSPDCRAGLYGGGILRPHIADLGRDCGGLVDALRVPQTCGTATPTKESRVTMEASFSTLQPSVPLGRIGSTIQR